MLQEKAQDRERLLLKFIKIMKVMVAKSSPGPHHQSLPGEPGTRLPSCLTAPPLSRQHLRKLNNFNSYLAILSALDSAPIRRLEWQKQTSEVSGLGAWVGGCLVKGAMQPSDNQLWQKVLPLKQRLGLGPCSATDMLCGQDSCPPTFLSLIASLQAPGSFKVGSRVVTSWCSAATQQAHPWVPISPALPQPVLPKGLLWAGRCGGCWDAL